MITKEEILKGRPILMALAPEEIDEIVEVVNECRMKGRYYTEDEIRIIQKQAYDEGLQADRSEF